MDDIVKETVILETTGVFSEDQTKRYELTKEYIPSVDGRRISVIMLNPASKKIQETDTTVNNLINRLSGEGYTTITILNLVPDIMSKLKPSKVDNLEANFEYIEEVLKRNFDKILIGYGNSFIGNEVVERAKYRLNQILKEYEDSLVEISDEFDTFECSAMHPLFASLRLDKWILKPYRLPKQELEPAKGKAKIEEKQLKSGLQRRHVKENDKDQAKNKE